jgi:hypothetical protein
VPSYWRESGMAVFGGTLNCKNTADVRQTVDDYNAWDGSASIYFNVDDGRFWTDATDRLLARMPRGSTAEDLVIVSKDILFQKTRISISTVKSMTENLLKNIEKTEV